MDSSSFYDADGYSDDDIKSVKSVKSGTKSSIDGQRSKLLNREYTTDQCLNILSSMGLGYTADQAAKKATSLTENVRSVELLDPRKMTTGSDKLSDAQIGRNVFEAVRNMISQGNEALIAVVKTNISLDTYLSDVQSRMFEIEDNIKQLERSYIEPLAPKEEILKLRLQDNLEEKEEELRHIALKEFQVRIGALPIDGADEAVRRSRRLQLQSDEKWEDSEEKAMFDAQYAEYVKVTTRTHRQTFLKLYDAYEKQMEKKTYAQRELQDHRDIMRRQQVIEIFVSELKKQCNLIVQKLKTALMSYPFIREKLIQNVLVNGESIMQPFATDNISGIYAILQQEYNKITMGAFCDYLMGLMSESSSSSRDESNKNPQLQLKRMDKNIKTWLDMDLEKFMTPDHLFTICLLRQYHPDSVIRTDGVRHVLEYARRLESDRMLKSNVGEYANMPLYTELVRWINDVQVKSMQFSNTSSSNVSSSSSSNKHSNMSSNSSKNGSMELAAVVNEASTNSGKGSVSKIPSNCTYASGPYDGEILRTRNLCTKRGYRYQALLHKCNPCSHQPRCFYKLCRKCNYYGHHEDDCCQVVRKDDTGQR